MPSIQERLAAALAAIRGIPESRAVVELLITGAVKAAASAAVLTRHAEPSQNWIVLKEKLTHTTGQALGEAAPVSLLCARARLLSRGRGDLAQRANQVLKGRNAAAQAEDDNLVQEICAALGEPGKPGSGSEPDDGAPTAREGQAGSDGDSDSDGAGQHEALETNEG